MSRSCPTRPARTDSLRIPTQFRGDVLATMEAKYADGSAAGRQLDVLPGVRRVLHPRLPGGAINLTTGFLSAINDGAPVTLTFHFWSGATVTYHVIAPARRSPAPPPDPIPLYGTPVRSRFPGSAPVFRIFRPSAGSSRASVAGDLMAELQPDADIAMGLLPAGQPALSPAPFVVLQSAHFSIVSRFDGCGEETLMPWEHRTNCAHGVAIRGFRRRSGGWARAPGWKRPGRFRHHHRQVRVRNSKRISLAVCAISTRVPRPHDARRLVS